jgi:hypothetical protein
MAVTETVIAAVTAFGGANGVAALIGALRKQDETQQKRPGPPRHGHRPENGHPPGTGSESQAQHSAAPASYPASSSLVPAACACLFAGALVTVARTTTLSLSQIPAVLLAVFAAAFAALAIWASGRLLWRSVSQRQHDLTMHASAALVVAFAALAATLIVGSA